MRIKLKQGKQKELIELAKSDNTWKWLSNKLNCSSIYLQNELRHEKRYLSENLFNLLCIISGKNFNKFIIEKLSDKWGRSKGGKNSTGNTKNFKEPEESLELAELFGIILGDGHLEKRIASSKIRGYSIRIAGDSRYDKEYFYNYISNLFNFLFNEKGTFEFSKKGNTIYIKIFGKKIVEFIEFKGLKPGNKKQNMQTIPLWIINNPEYLKACLRGLIDTDGCIYYISKQNKNLRITFTSYIPKLMEDVRLSFVKLGYHPSKIIRNKDISLSRKEDVNKFMSEIKFSNPKHLKRVQNLIKN